MHFLSALNRAANQRTGLTHARSSTSKLHQCMRKWHTWQWCQIHHCHRNICLSYVVPFMFTTATINILLFASASLKLWEVISMFKIVAACIPHQNVICSYIIKKKADLGPDKFLLKTYANSKKQQQQQQLGFCSLDHKVLLAQAEHKERWWMTVTSPPFCVQVSTSQMHNSWEKYRVGKGYLKLGLRERFPVWPSEWAAQCSVHIH